MTDAGTEIVSGNDQAWFVRANTIDNDQARFVRANILPIRLNVDANLLRSRIY
jgi:hypothetical protein